MGLRDFEFFRRELVRLGIVQHELTEHACVQYERNEGERGDSFAGENFPEFAANHYPGAHPGWLWAAREGFLSATACDPLPLGGIRRIDHATP